MEQIYSIQDFNLVKSNIQRVISLYSDEFNFSEESIGFIIFILERFFNLQDDEFADVITDGIFVTKQSFFSWKNDFSHDRWIDAIIINEDEKIIELFNFKYKNNFKDVWKHFESWEIDKVISFIKNLLERDFTSLQNVNPKILEKIKEIEYLQDKKYINFKFKINFVANIYNGFTKDEKDRLDNECKKYRGAVSYNFILLWDIANKLSSTEKNINWKFRAIDNKFFEKSWYWYKAFLCEIKWEDIIRITLNDDELRYNCDVPSEELVWKEINEDAFEDNVRIYLKQNTNINQWIKSTALDIEESLRFFFFNNGITITCNKIIPSHATTSPIISLEWLQIVNWWQTIHSLKEAFDEDYTNFKNISLLCRIYETQDSKFKSKIAEFTNNQNAVTDRDIRSIDVCQIKLEEDLKLKWYFYERKKNFYEWKEKKLRIDAEKLWQAMLAFYLEMPMEAKNRKKIIFLEENYKKIFNSDLTAEKALLAINLYEFIEAKKKENKSTKDYLNHATYFILFFMKKIVWNWKSFNEYVNVYQDALGKIEYVIEKEKLRLGEDYFDAHLFKSNRPKSYLSEIWL
jgi:hypothetical protein